jgi:predicted PurR-regulated permease PerM
MEQSLFFVLGVLAVLAFAGVVSMFKTVVQIKDLRDEISNVYNSIDETERRLDQREEMLNRRIDQEIDRLDATERKLYEYADQLHSKHEDDLNELYRYVDSRTDKMADGFSKHIAEINSQIAGAN